MVPPAYPRPASSNGRRSPPTVKFPDFAPELPKTEDEESYDEASRDPSPRPLLNELPAGLHSSKRWPARKHTAPGRWGARTGNDVDGTGRGYRQKSLTEALRNVRTRKMSMSENAHEIAESLKAPVSVKLVVLCVIWFSTSILSNASSKAILTALPKPVTLTIMQFALVSFWCLFLSWLAKRNPTLRNAVPVLKNGVRKPNKDLILTTLPLTAFQIGGHILNSDAMARIPVQLVHTIKGLAPLMTVFAYRSFFDAQYSRSTYLSLIPLTLGVVMACSASFKGNLPGLIYAFGSTILFVTQNIVSKKIFEDASKAEADGTPIGRRKPDKLNLLCYSSALAFLLTFPIWVWSEAIPMFSEYLDDGSVKLRIRPGSLDHGALSLEFIFNGTFHFGQSLLAFVLLGLVSPVTYSVASLIKRVAVIIFAVVWFGIPMTKTQGMGFVLTFLGLYLYDRTSDAGKVDNRVKEKLAAAIPLLPLNTSNTKREVFVETETPMTGISPFSVQDPKKPFIGGGGYTNGTAIGSGPGRPRGGSGSLPTTNGVLLPGSKAEDTWDQGDVMSRQPLAI